MILDIYSWHTDITLTGDEVKQLCKPGEGANTCVWLIASAKGMECTCLHKMMTLVDRFNKGQTVAKRDGCDFVHSIRPHELGLGRHELEVK